MWFAGIVMHVFMNIAIRILEIMFGIGLAISCVSIVLGTIDDIKTFIRY
jgi:hypothetical protein